MERKYDPLNRYATLTIALSIASLALVIASVFMIQTLSIAYGISIGASTQSGADSRAVSASLTQVVTNSHTIYTTLLAEYVGLIVSLGMLISAVLLYRYRFDIMSMEARGHINFHGMLALVYVLLFSIYISSVPIAVNMYYVGVVYLAMFVCLVVDLYNIASRYLIPKRSANMKVDALSIDPSMPYTNLIKMKDRIFSKLRGSVYVVDKHMNSVGIENLHRLIKDNPGKIPAINILTSRDMLDGEFTKNYTDWKSEMDKAGIKLNVMVMNENDSSAQHERFIFDKTHAYKVPPFNIIHKKSEHITKINFPESKKRYDQLYQHAMKYENFIVKMGQSTS